MSLVDAPGVVVVRGAGDLATGVIQKLVHAGFGVVAVEVPAPLAIRWRAALCTAVTRGRWAVEDLTGVHAESWTEASELLGEPGVVPVLVDPDAALLARLQPWAVVDAILAKRNLGTHRGMAPVTVGLGPGFTAGDDVDYVVETMRGHRLGRVIAEGPPLPNTGVPGLIAGRAAERVLHAPASGEVRVLRKIGDLVAADEALCLVGGVEARTSIAGVVRGMIPDGSVVPAGLKVADVDPRVELAGEVDAISDKARAVGGAALDAVMQGLVARGLWTPPGRP